MVNKNSNNKKPLIKAVQAVLTALLLIAFAYILWYKYDSIQSDKKLKEINKIASEFQVTSSNLKTESSIISSSSEEEQKKEMLALYKPLFEINKDLVGWLEIKDTKLSVPVVQGNNNEYYLEHDFYKEKDKRGTVFVDCNANIADTPPNLILYGHYVSDKSMFGILEEYKDKNYFDKHPIIEFNSLYEKRSYEIISVFLSKVYEENEDVFKYYDFNLINSESEFETYAQNILKLSLVDTGKHASYGDELITLSTCDYYTDDGRLVLVARRVV